MLGFFSNRPNWDPPPPPHPQTSGAPPLVPRGDTLLGRGGGGSQFGRGERHCGTLIYVLCEEAHARLYTNMYKTVQIDTIFDPNLSNWKLPLSFNFTIHIRRITEDLPSVHNIGSK
jgi:hypothetical protein